MNGTYTNLWLASIRLKSPKERLTKIEKLWVNDGQNLSLSLCEDRR